MNLGSDPLHEGAIVSIVPSTEIAEKQTL